MSRLNVGPAGPDPLSLSLSKATRKAGPAHMLRLAQHERTILQDKF